MMNRFDEETHKYYSGGRELPSVTEICSLLTAGKYEGGGALMEQARRRGSLVHECCEMLDYGADISELEIYPETAGYVSAYLRFIRDYQPEWTHIEHRLYGREFAGTLDRYGRMDGLRAIVDLKTTGTMDRRSRIALVCQLNGYDRLCRENGLPAPDILLGVQLKKNGRYTIHSYESIHVKYGIDADGLFDSCLEITKATGGYQ